MELTPLECDVMKLMLNGDSPGLAILSEQLSRSDVSAREFTGVGFVTKFAVSNDAARLKHREPFFFGDVEAQVDGLLNGAGFILHVKDGLIDFLEGYGFDEAWPKVVRAFSVAYVNNRRDTSDVDIFLARG